MKTDLTIVIASHADNVECLETVNSIYRTAALPLTQFRLRILIVDDASPVPVCQTIPTMERYTAVTHWRNTHRIGCGPSRYVGVCLARDSEWILFVDSHSRFMPGWFEAWEARADKASTTMHCGSCLAFDAKNPVPNEAKPYFGATWNFYGPDRHKPKVKQCFECIWHNEQSGDEYEIPAVMGAQYFLHREFFLKLGALRHLRSWGGDEMELSLKVWLAGGCIRLLKKVRIAHKFKAGGLSKIQPWEVPYNKLFLIQTILPPDKAKILLSKMPRDGHLTVAQKRLRDDWHLVETERAHNAATFTRSFPSYLEQFGLQFPT